MSDQAFQYYLPTNQQTRMRLRTVARTLTTFGFAGVAARDALFNLSIKYEMPPVTLPIKVCKKLMDAIAFFRTVPRRVLLPELYQYCAHKIYAGDKPHEYGQHFTPIAICDFVVRKALEYSPPSDQQKTMCDPCCGTANMLACPDASGLRHYGFDIDPEIQKYAQANVGPDDVIAISNTLEMPATNQYDIVCSNPPFEKRTIGKFINKFLELTKPGGVCAFVAPYSTEMASAAYADHEVRLYDMSLGFDFTGARSYVVVCVKNGRPGVFLDDVPCEPKYKQTALNLLPAFYYRWEGRPIGEFCTITRGNISKSARAFIPGDYPVICGGVKPLCTSNEHNTPPAVYILRRGSCGRVIKIETPSFNTNAYACVPVDGVTLNELYERLKTVESRIKKLGVGVCIPDIPQDLLNMIRV